MCSWTYLASSPASRATFHLRCFVPGLITDLESCLSSACVTTVLQLREYPSKLSSHATCLSVCLVVACAVPHLKICAGATLSARAVLRLCKCADPLPEPPCGGGVCLYVLLAEPCGSGSPALARMLSVVYTGHWARLVMLSGLICLTSTRKGATIYQEPARSASAAKRRCACVPGALQSACVCAAPLCRSCTP